MLVVGGVGLFCGRVHLQTRGIKGNQGESRGSMWTEEKRDEIRDPGKQ